MSLYKGLVYMVRTRGEGDSFHAWSLEEIDRLRTKLAATEDALKYTMNTLDSLLGYSGEMSAGISKAREAMAMPPRQEESK